MSILTGPPADVCRILKLPRCKTAAGSRIRVTQLASASSTCCRQGRNSHIVGFQRGKWRASVEFKGPSGDAAHRVTKGRIRPIPISIRRRSATAAMRGDDRPERSKRGRVKAFIGSKLYFTRKNNRVKMAYRCGAFTGSGVIQNRRQKKMSSTS